jgi:twinkle protein
MELEKILEQRKISEETASKLGWHVLDNWLVMPVIKDGKVIGSKKRRFGEDKAFIQDKGTPQIFYNYDAIHVEEPLVITEGELDCAVAIQCGYTAVSVPNGAPNQPIEGGNKYAYLEDLPEGKEIILAFDDDPAGHNLLHDVSSRIGKAYCKWVKYPVGCKDLNETLIKYGKKGVSESIKRAQYIKVDGLCSMSDLPPPAFTEAIPCPVDGMGDYYKLRRGDFTVVTGIPGMGKTTFVNEIVAQMAIKHQWKACVATFEQNPRADFEPWLHTHFNGKPAHLQTPEQIEKARHFVESYIKLIVPTEDADIDLLWLKERIEVAVLRYNCQLVVVDPWNEMDHLHPAGMSQTEYTGFAIRQLKKLASKLNVHMIVVTHPAKMSRNRDGEYPQPSLYDIADSAHWRNKADMGLIVHRDDDKSSRVIVAKCRYWGKIGKTGEVELTYDDYRNTFKA